MGTPTTEKIYTLPEREEIVTRSIEVRRWALFEYDSDGTPSSGWQHTTVKNARENIDRLTTTRNVIGINLGEPSGLAVLDIDVQNGGTREALEARFGPMPDTYTVSTPSGGEHLYFAYPSADRLMAAGIGELRAIRAPKCVIPGIDFLANGCNVAAPPSYRNTIYNNDGTLKKPAGSYVVVRDTAVAELPDNVLRAWAEAMAPRRPVDIEITEYVEAPSLYWDTVIRWHEQNVRMAAEAPEGTRDNAVYGRLCASMQLQYCVPDDVLSIGKVRSDFEQGVPYPIKDPEGKIARAVEYAQKNPRNPFGARPVDFGDDKGYIPQPDFVARVFTDGDLGDRLAEICDGRVRHVVGRGWMVWTGSRWLWDEKQLVVKRLARRLSERLKADLNAALDAGIFHNPQSVSKNSAVTAVRQAGSNGGLGRMLTAMASRPDIDLDADKVNARADLLGVANGVVNLRTGELLPPDPGFFITDVIEYDYVPGAEAPRWRQFLREIYASNPDIADYMQQVVGYGLTGFTTEQCAIWAFGSGSNGKTKMIEALQHVFGPISATIQWSTFALGHGASGGQVRPDLVRLVGKRLVFAEESNAGTRMDEGLFKQFTGEGTVTARMIHSADIEYKPQALVFVTSNHMPKIRGVDDGIWRRFRFVEHMEKFEGAQRDPRLAEKLRNESHGILAWAVEGARLWFASGQSLRPPAAVQEKGDEYRDESDPLKEFVKSRLIEEKGAVCRVTDAWKAYKDWCYEEDIDAWKKPTFIEAMRERRFRTFRDRKSVQHFRGCRLR